MVKVDCRSKLEGGEIETYAIDLLSISVVLYARF